MYFLSFIVRTTVSDASTSHRKQIVGTVDVVRTFCMPIFRTHEFLRIAQKFIGTRSLKNIENMKKIAFQRALHMYSHENNLNLASSVFGGRNSNS